MTTTNDSSDLESLFDTIAADYVSVASVPPAVKPVPVSPKASPVGDDSDDLQALFDSVVAEAQAVQEVVSVSTVGLSGEAGESWSQQEVVFNRIGQMARTLHDTLSQLGYDKILEKTVSVLPDAKDRLAYIANLTEQAACRVLNATDVAGPLVDEIESGGKALSDRWDKVFANQMAAEEFRQLAVDTRAFLKTELPQKAKGTHAQLTEIMMAQDFQDLTGQVIKKIVVLAQDLESNLMSVLLEVVPETKRTEEVNSLMNGPVVKAEGRTDVVVNQGQVDDLLDSLGF